MVAVIYPAMNPPESRPAKLTLTAWLVLIIASIGFLFDTYELLMTPLAGVPAIAELLQLPPNNPVVIRWFGNMLWITALCGGVFGLVGGWLIDRFGRKTVMAASIFLYAFSPFAAAFSTSLPMFFFFRCTTFIGVCVEFVAAITWLAELFPDKRQKEIALGSTQAFASLGGLFVTGMNVWIAAHTRQLSALSKVLGSPEAAKKLEKGATLDEASLYVDSKQVTLGYLQRQLEKIFEKIKTLSPGKEESAKILCVIEEFSKRLRK